MGERVKAGGIFAKSLRPAIKPFNRAEKKEELSWQYQEQLRSCVGLFFPTFNNNYSLGGMIVIRGLYKMGAPWKPAWNFSHPLLTQNCYSLLDMSNPVDRMITPVAYSIKSLHLVGSHIPPIGAGGLYINKEVWRGFHHRAPSQSYQTKPVLR